MLFYLVGASQSYSKYRLKFALYFLSQYKEVSHMLKTRVIIVTITI